MAEAATSLSKATSSVEPLATFVAFASATIRASPSVQLAELPSTFKALVASFAYRCS